LRARDGSGEAKTKRELDAGARKRAGELKKSRPDPAKEVSEGLRGREAVDFV